MAEPDKNEDLPLVSNVDKVFVRHYNLDFKCEFEAKLFTCSAILFLEPVSDGNDNSCFCSKNKNVVTEGHDPSQPSDTGFELVLDCHQIKVKEVVALDPKLPIHACATSELLNFSASTWALKIWRDAGACRFCFPSIVRISYETLPSCPSLLWVEDQLGKPAVFTFGAYVNNRSLLPCQEPPVAMATWEAIVTVTDSAIVLMSGDEVPLVTNREGVAQYHYHCRKVLPMSTLCLAVGFWEEYAIDSHIKFGGTCRLFACGNRFNKSIQDLSKYIPQCVTAAEEILGVYPFPRIDFLIVPPTFGSLGMASPNLVFLSQSLLAEGDTSLLSRVSHEVSHGWFGLSVGALDWTEEWLSEGFATFMEDIVHTRTIGMPSSDAKEFLELRAFLRKRILSHEVENTKEELQVLRPSFGDTTTLPVDGTNATVLKNGQNPLKTFMQVHYIKGYFLLKYLCDILGMNAFLCVLRAYVSNFEGSLVTSRDFFAFLFDSSPELKNTLSVESISEDWLHNSGMPPEIEKFEPSSHNKLHTQVLEETAKWRKLNKTFNKRKAKRRKSDLECFSSMLPEQVVLLLEILLEEEDKMNALTLSALDRKYGLKRANAEVQHRWFEFVVKYRVKSEYAALKDFLVNHLALGVYLYGEMIHSGTAVLARMAQECFQRLQPHMEPSYRTVIEGMIASL